MLSKLWCWLGQHDWDKYSGFYQERVANGAHCKRVGCEAVYHGR